MGTDSVESFRKIVGRYLDQLEYIRNISDEAPFFPQHVHIEPTNMCNLRCIHCIQEAMTRKRGLMDWQVYVKVIDEIAPLKCAITFNVQGEPLLHPRIIDMVAYAKDKGIHVSILTNATRLKKEYVEKLTDLKLDRIVFSFEGVSKEVYEKIRIRANYERTLKNVLNFIKRNHDKGHSTHVCVSAVMSNDMVPWAEEFEKRFTRLPIDKVFLNPHLNMLGKAGTASQVEAAGFADTQLNGQWPTCRVPWEDITVNWDGEVCLCPVDFNVDWSIGNVRDLSLVDMWNNDKSRTFRSAHLKHDFENVEVRGKLCSQCNCMWLNEYDIAKDYKQFINEAIIRQARHFAAALSDAGPGEDNEDRYGNLLKMMKELAL